MSLLAPRGESEEHWLSVSDLMAGLMAVFLFIAISYMLEAQRAYRDLEDFVVVYDSVRVELYKALRDEFEEDLELWQAEIDPSLVVTFREPKVLFGRSSAELQPRFKEILDSFFPRYVAILTEDVFADEIDEVRIEGHTSSEWSPGVVGLEAYINNMRLSQARTSNVLNYVLQMDDVRDQTSWVRNHLISIGFSSSRIREDSAGREDSVASRRVEFQVRTKAQERLEEMARKAREESENWAADEAD